MVDRVGNPFGMGAGPAGCGAQKKRGPGGPRAGCSRQRTGCNGNGRGAGRAAGAVAPGPAPGGCGRAFGGTLDGNGKRAAQQLGGGFCLPPPLISGFLVVFLWPRGWVRKKKREAHVAGLLFQSPAAKSSQDGDGNKRVMSLSGERGLLPLMSGMTFELDTPHGRMSAQ